MESAIPNNNQIRQPGFSQEWSAIGSRIIEGQDYYNVFTCAANVMKFLPGWRVINVEFDQGLIEAECVRFLRTYDILVIVSGIEEKKYQMEIQITPQKKWLTFSKPNHIVEDYFAGYDDLQSRWELTAPPIE